MSLTPRQIEVLARWADHWLDADPDTRIALRAQAANEGDAVLRAFDAMVNALAADTPTEAIGRGFAPGAVLPPPITPTMRAEALVSAAERAAEDGDRASHAGHAEPHTARAREAGQRIGPYRLIRELGRGGMGAVWLAERADGQHTRQVALKVPLVENLNWLLAARFARERSILASLEHPGIARLYDAGVDQETQPYIAIEYVGGVAITDYVRAHKLRPDAVVTLFIRVIDAVAYAHTQLVLHRDIKPSNILVDDKGNPHLLDFGIAKLLDDEDTEAVDATQLTRLSGRALTLDYASPEQVNNLPIGTASDIYSLGVLLFELLTGSRPYHPKGPSRRELEQAILDQDAPRPSEHLLVTAQQTGDSEGSKTARRLRGDLDTIVLTALRKDPKQRYATAQAFADDLRRYLAVEPIQARPQGAAYRIGKFMRRHRWGLIGAFSALIVFGVLGGYSVYQQRAVVASLGRAQAVDSLLQHLFRGMSPDVAATRSFTANELLDRAEQFIGADPLLDSNTRQSAYRSMADLYRQIGEYEKEIKLYQQQRTAAAADGDASREGDALAGLAEASTALEKLDDADRYCVALKALIDRGGVDASWYLARLSYQRGLVQRARGQPKMALQHLDDAVARLQGRADRSARLLLADTQRAAGEVSIAASELRGAGPRLQSALAIYESVGEARAFDALDAQATLLSLQVKQGDFAAAIRRGQPLLTELERRLGKTHPITIDVLQSLANAYLRTGDFVAARASSRAIRDTGGASAAEYRRIDDFVNARVALYSGDVDAAERQLRTLYATLSERPAAQSFVALALAQALLARQKLDEAVTVLDHFDHTVGASLGPRSPRVLVARLLRACALAKRGDRAQASLLIESTAVALRDELGTDYYVTLVSEGYAQLFQTAPRDASWRQHADALAARIENTLAWQAGAAELVAWLRAPHDRHDWQKLPVVL